MAEFGAHPLPHGVRVAVFNRSRTFGASPVYDPAEPDYLLVNISVGEVDLWDGDGPQIASERGPDFLSWYQRAFRPAVPLSGDEYLSRAVVGRYLHEGFERVLSHLPPGMEVTCFVGEVTDIAPGEVGHTLTFVDDGRAGAHAGGGQDPVGHRSFPGRGPARGPRIPALRRPGAAGVIRPLRLSRVDVGLRPRRRTRRHEGNRPDVHRCGPHPHRGPRWHLRANAGRATLVQGRWGGAGDDPSVQPERAADGTEALRPSRHPAPPDVRHARAVGNPPPPLRTTGRSTSIGTCGRSSSSRWSSSTTGSSWTTITGGGWWRAATTAPPCAR